ncbi:MAG: NAD(P)-dependent oxidoreductase [Runella sp.]
MNVLIVDEIHPSLFEMLDSLDLKYSYLPHLKRADILNHIADYEGLIIRSKTRVDTEILAVASRLRFVARAGAGLDLIDLEAVQKRNIRLFAANEGNCDAVAEHTVGLLLGLMAHIAKADREIRQGIWQREPNRGIELMGKTVGVIGYGFNGRATAQRLSGFGCRILAFDKYLTNYGDEFATEASLSQIMKEAQVVSLHIPLTHETRHLVNDAFINQMAHPFFLLNISRGEVVDLEAVVRGMKEGKIMGAGLDVLENEKLDQLTPSQKAIVDYLRNSDKVILTPHVAGWTQESYVKINEVLVRQIAETFKLPQKA